MIRIVDAKSGAILAEGKQEGGTGDTRLIMREPHARGMTVYDTEGTAGFLAELMLSEPTIVTISAVGPLEYPQATMAASRQMLLVPGRHVEGDGVVLELNGLIVEILSPEPMTPVQGVLDVSVRVRMMCGCPIEPGGLWDADQKTFVAQLRADGRVVSESQLEFAQGRDLEVMVVVSDEGAGNFGKHMIPLGWAE
jgi:hypothetical protein